MVDLLPAPLSMNALNVAIPRLTCSDTQRPRWLEVYFGNGFSCLLRPKSILLQSLSRVSPKALRCKIVESCSSATDLISYPHWVWREMGCAAADPTDQKSLRPRWPTWTKAAGSVWGGGGGIRTNPLPAGEMHCGASGSGFPSLEFSMTYMTYVTIKPERR